MIQIHTASRDQFNCRPSMLSRRRMYNTDNTNAANPKNLSDFFSIYAIS